MLKAAYRFGVVLLCTTSFSNSLFAQEYDPQAMCQQAAEGLLPEDAATYVENCLSDYRANMGIEPAEPLGESMPSEADQSDPEPVPEASEIDTDRN